MKKSETIDLTIPQRQSQWAIIFIILKFFRAFVSQAWLLLIPIVLGRNSSSSGWSKWELGIAAAGVFSTIWSIISYFKFYFNLTDTEVVIRKGVIQKSNINIPYERIQSVNFKQNFLHQMLNVTEVVMDTAGSVQKEIQIDALSWDHANALRNEILKRKKVTHNSSKIDADDIAESEIIENEILSLSFMDLFKVGLTQNHLKLAGLIIGFFFSMWIYAWEFEMDPIDVVRNAYSFVEDRSIIESTGLFILLAIFSILYSIVTTFLNHYNLRFFRVENKFHLTQGLLTRKEVAATDKKIQYITWGQNILQRIIGFFQLRFDQAGSVAINEKGKYSFKIPGCSDEQINYVQAEWLGEKYDPKNLQSITIHYFYYSLRWLIGIFTIVIGANLYLGIYKSAVFLTLLFIYLTYMTWLSYKKKKYVADEKYLYISGGGFGFKYVLMPTFKIQNVRIDQSPYQWRRKLATLKIFTAAGALEIPYITEQKATELMDFLLYQVERSKKAWM